MVEDGPKKANLVNLVQLVTSNGWWYPLVGWFWWSLGSSQVSRCCFFCLVETTCPKIGYCSRNPPECEVYSVSCGDIIKLSAMMEMHVVHLFQYIVINWLLEELNVFTGLCYNASMKIVGNECRTSKSSLQNVATGWIQGNNYTVSGFDLLKSSMITYFIIFPKQTLSTWVTKLCHRSWGWILWRAWLWHWDPD